ncbi:hypothetical protein [Actinophytocola sp.]
MSPGRTLRHADGRTMPLATLFGRTVAIEFHAAATPSTRRSR